MNGAWLAMLAAVLLLLGQHYAGVLHPAYVPLVLILVALLGSTIVCVLCCICSLVRLPDWRRATLGFLLASLIPILVVWTPCEYARRQWQQRRIPKNTAMVLAKMVGASLMEMQADLLYPNRVEQPHLVMYFDRLETPLRDAKALEGHIVRLEKLLNRPLRASVHWVRGSLLGQRNLSFYGLALGSDRSRIWNGPGGALDRHEIAHAVLNQFQTPDSDPPMLLHEGWAEAQAGWDSRRLAQSALELRRTGREMPLSDLVGPEWYHQDSGPVYTQGGPLVDYLLRSHGIDKFVKLYNTSRPGRFDATCQRVLGVDLATLEAAYWEDAQATSERAP